MSFFNELKRRNVFRMGIAYIVVAWVLLQVIDFTLDIISAPNWVMQVFFLAGVAGLPVVLIFAWIFEMTPEGIKLESEVDRSQSVTQSTGSKLDRTIIAFLAFAVVLLMAERFTNTEKGSGSISPETSISMPTGNVEKLNLAPLKEKVRSVAVLPFVNMSSDPEQEYFSDGLSEELLNRLAQNDQLRVAARTSSFQFKGQNQDIGEIGRQLKVEHVLEGSVRKSANRIRITAQLIEVDSGYHIWSETYEREINDIFAIQDDISLAITRALEAELGASSASTDSQSTENLAAYQLYLEARYLLAQRGEANMLRANELFEQAVGLDPGFSSAWSGMAFTYALLPAYGSVVSARQAWEKVKISANKAIQLDPANAESYVTLGWANIDDEYTVIRTIFEKAYELAPNNVNVVNLYADFMARSGDFHAAERLERKAIELDPLAAVHYSDIAFVLFSLGRYKEGLDHGRTSASLAPDSIDRTDPLVIGLILNGLYDEAIQTIQRLERQADSNIGFATFWWCMLYYQQGNEQKLRGKVAERIQHLEIGTGGFDYTSTAFYTTWLDGTDAALPLLAKASERNEYLLTWPEYFYLPEDISDDPDWLAFWQQPRLAELMDIRRKNKTQEHIGYWKERPAQ
jgi:TolB-like protein/cytochrome c-type biogenesis protein CcmH/NrfG